MQAMTIGSKGVDVRKCVFLVIGFEVLIVILAIGFYGYTTEALQAIARYSGRLSLLIFSIIFILQSNPVLINEWLSRHFYFVFCVAHGIHLIELLAYVRASETKLIPLRVAGGALAYLLIFIMPVIHLLFTKGRISQKVHSTLSQVYLYYVWFIFLMAYIPRVQGKLPNAGGTFTEHVLLLIFVLAILVVRVVYISKQRLRSQNQNASSLNK
jgi:hypothetical protein